MLVCKYTANCRPTVELQPHCELQTYCCKHTTAYLGECQAVLSEVAARLSDSVVVHQVCIATPCMTSTEEHKHPYAAASDGDIPSSKASSLNAATNSTLSHGSLPQTHSADSSATVPNPISRKALFPEVQAIPLHGSPAAGLPGTFTAAGHSHAPDLRSFKDWSGNVSSPQLTTAAHAEQQQLAVGLHKPVACSTAGQPATRQAPGNAVGQSAVQTQSVAALQRAAKALPSWAETTFQNSPGTLLDHGFLASAVMLETLGRQKQALSRHATCGSPLQQIKAEISPHTGGSGPGGFSPGSPTSHKWVTIPCYVLLHFVLLLLIIRHRCCSRNNMRLHFAHRHMMTVWLVTM